VVSWWISSAIKCGGAAVLRPWVCGRNWRVGATKKLSDAGQTRAREHYRYWYMYVCAEGPGYLQRPTRDHLMLQISS
jgi:hypothetical protein